MTKKRITLIVRILLAVGTVVSLYFVPWPMLKAWALPLPDTVQEQLDEAIGHGLDGIIVYVDEAGQPPAFYASGWHDRDAKIPADPHALFKIASIGKLYDAVCIAKLVHDGRLSLDQTLGEFFPELVGKIENAQTISLRLMVQHRSGIPNFTNAPDFWSDPPGSSQEALALIFDMPASFAPGEGYEYSNTNYLLLSEIIKKVTGADKSAFIRERILEPLKLKNTFCSLRDVDMDRLMSGYYVGVAADLKTEDKASVIATAQDVGTFLRALNDGSLFEGGEQQIYSSIYVYEHTGLIPGYQSIARYHADMDAVVIQFVNTANFSGYTWGIHELVYGRVVKILKKSGPQ